MSVQSTDNGIIEHTRLRLKTLILSLYAQNTYKIKQFECITSLIINNQCIKSDNKNNKCRKSDSKNNKLFMKIFTIKLNNDGR